jgi:hypothetical protein
MTKLHYGPLLDIKRYGKRTAVHSAAEIWTGTGVVAGFGALVLLKRRGPLAKLATTAYMEIHGAGRQPSLRILPPSPALFCCYAQALDATGR